MTRAWPLLAVLLAAPAAAGIFGGGPPTRIPKPSKPFVASVEDHGGVVTRIGSVSWDGEVYVSGRLGAADVAVPFESVAELRVVRGDEERRRIVVLQTRDEQEVRLVVDADVPVYGRTAYGNYRIEAREIRRMTLAPE